MAITQLSLFLMNQPGQLVDAVGILSEGGANIRAMSIAESNDFFRQSIQYFNAAIGYIDGLTDPEAIRMQKKNLFKVK